MRCAPQAGGAETALTSLKKRAAHRSSSGKLFGINLRTPKNFSTPTTRCAVIKGHRSARLQQAMSGKLPGAKTDESRLFVVLAIASSSFAALRRTSVLRLDWHGRQAR